MVDDTQPAPDVSSGAGPATRWLLGHGFFLAVAVLLVVVVATDLPDLLGRRPAQVVRRNSEGIAMVLVGWYWVRYAGGRDLAGRGGRRPAPVRPGEQVAWFGLWAVAAVVLQVVALGWVELSLSPRLVTLGEAAATVLLVSLYVGATRGTMPGPLHQPTGGVVPSARRRAALLVAVVAAVVAVHLLGSPPVPAVVDDLVRLNVELVAGVLLLVVTIDAVVTPPTTRGRVLAWCGAMLAVPLVVAVAGDRVLPTGLADWTSRATEAFLAAAVLSAWSWVWQRAQQPGRPEA